MVLDTVKHRDFSVASYERHAQGYDEYAPGGARVETARAWLRPDTINSWRFVRMYACANPLLEAAPGARWLTVGDGRYGLDAMYLRARGADALATDISETLLAESKANGLITDYRVENAEALTFADGAFDFVLCKESYHHFPRPMLALYEMLRVARCGVILIEPNDHMLPDGVRTTLSRLAKNAIKKLLGRPADGHDFEELGNYVYGISRREIEKVALGIGLPVVAFKGINDYYLPGVEFEPARDDSALFRKVRARVARYDLLCRIGFSQYGLLGAVILKASDSALEARLTAHGYDVVHVPDNPYTFRADVGAGNASK